MSYATVALKAAELAADKKNNPVDSWERCVKIEYPGSPSSQKKGCPKNTFLGLCEEGLVKGIPGGKYTKSVDNKRYALHAVKILKENNKKHFESNELWNEVLKLETDKNKRPNSQMDVVLGLWENGFIKK